MNSKKPELTVVAGDQAALRRKVVQDLLHFRSSEARQTLDQLARRGELRSVSESAREHSTCDGSSEHPNPRRQ